MCGRASLSLGIVVKSGLFEWLMGRELPHSAARLLTGFKHQCNGSRPNNKQLRFQDDRAEPQQTLET